MHTNLNRRLRGKTSCHWKVTLVAVGWHGMREGLTTLGYRGDLSQVKAERFPGDLSAAKPLPVKQEHRKTDITQRKMLLNTS